MATREQKRFLVLLGWLCGGAIVFVTCGGIVMVVLKLLGIVSSTPITFGADAGAARTPLTDLSVTFHETTPSESYALTLDPKRTLACTHDGVAATTRTCAFELEPFEAALQKFHASEEGAGRTHFDLHVTSSSSTVDAAGDPTSAENKAIVDELQKLCALASAKITPFEIVYSRIEQGGTAGKHETIELRSDGAFTVKDAFMDVIKSGTAPIVEIAALARLVARPELAALGTTYVDPTPAPSVMEVDYVFTISKTTTLKGVFHDRTPDIISAISSEMMRVTVYSTP